MEQDSVTSDGPVDVPAPSEKAVRYYRSGNVIWAVEQLLGLALPALLLFTGLSARLRTFAAASRAGHFYPTLVVYLALLVALLLFVVQLPFTCTSATCASTPMACRRSGSSKWASDEVKGLVLGVVVGARSCGCPTCCWRSQPERWWLWTGALALPFFGWCCW